MSVTMTVIPARNDGRHDLASTACECVWICRRGRTQLSCRIRHHREDDVEVEVVRNARLYGKYRFVERMAALLFATRLRLAFEGNGWIAT